jgi:hypothetical protein
MPPVHELFIRPSYMYTRSVPIRHIYYCSITLFLLMGAGIAQWYSAGLRAGWSGVRNPAGAGNFSLHHRVQTGSGNHSASYPMGTRGSIPVLKRPGCKADHSSPSSVKVKECLKIYLHSPNMPSWGGAQLKHRDNFTFICLFVTTATVVTTVLYFSVSLPLSGY